VQRATIQRIVDGLPDEVDLDAFVERLYLLQKIEIGERQLAEGRGISHEEARKRLQPWIG
jgi:predicted transcriptional regulator